MIPLLVVGSSDCTASNFAIACLQPQIHFVCTIYEVHTPTPLPLLGQTREAELFYCYCITWPCSVIQKPIYSALFKAWGSDLAFVYGTLGTLAATWPT